MVLIGAKMSIAAGLTANFDSCLSFFHNNGGTHNVAVSCGVWGIKIFFGHESSYAGFFS